jgi:predicted ATP-dependent endonuclease of OLD family
MKIKKIVFNKKYKQFSEKISIDIDDGFNVFVGENGIGKSTILNLINIISDYDEKIFTSTKKQVSLYVEMTKYIYERIIGIVILLTMQEKKITKDDVNQKLLIKNLVIIYKKYMG